MSEYNRVAQAAIPPDYLSRIVQWAEHPVQMQTTPWAHSIVIDLLRIEMLLAILPLIKTQASDFFIPLLRILTRFLWILVFYLRAKFLIYYFTMESGEVVLSIIEPAHSIQATSMIIHCVFLKLAAGRSRMQILHSIFQKVRPRRNFIIKLVKAAIMICTPYLTLYESYIGLRVVRYLVYNAGRSSNPFAFLNGILFWIAVYWRGGTHTFLSKAMLACWLLTLIGVNLQRLTQFLIFRFTYQIFDTHRSFAGFLFLLQTLYSFVVRRFPDIIWNDRTNTSALQPGSKALYMQSATAGTETQLFAMIASVLSNIAATLVPSSVFFLYPMHKAKYFCSIPLVTCTLHRSICLSYGTRRLNVGEDPHSPGIIGRIAREYTDVDDRVDAVVDYFLRLEPGAAISYRHEDTRDQSYAKIERLVSEAEFVHGVAGRITVLWADVFVEQVRDVEQLEVEWLEIGLEPYMIFAVLREANIADGEDRLWLSLEQRASRRVITNVGEELVAMPNLLQWMYYICGKVLLMLAWDPNDVRNAARIGQHMHASLDTSFAWPKLVFWMDAMRKLDVVHFEFGKVGPDGRLLTVIIISEDELSTMRRTLSNLLGCEHNIYEFVDADVSVGEDAVLVALMAHRVVVQSFSDGIRLQSAITDVTYCTDASISIDHLLQDPNPDIFSWSSPVLI